MLSDAINFSLDVQENFYLLNGKWFFELKEKYKCIQTGNNYTFPDNSSCSWDSENNSFKIEK